MNRVTRADIPGVKMGGSLVPEFSSRGVQVPKEEVQRKETESIAHVFTENKATPFVLCDCIAA